MTLLAFLNSGFGLFVISTIFSVIGLFIKLIYNTLSKHSESIKDLEYQIKDISNVKGSVSGIGARVGEVESSVKVLDSQQNTILDHLSDLKEERKDSSQMMADIFNSINAMKTSIAVIISRMDDK